MRAALIQQTADFTLTSYGRGTAYELRNTADALAVFVQGDDAATFRDELESYEAHNPNGDGLAYLWEQYATVAAPV